MLCGLSVEGIRSEKGIVIEIRGALVPSIVRGRKDGSDKMKFWFLVYHILN